MTDPAEVRARVDDQFAAVVDAAGDTSQSDWLATATAKQRVRDRLAALTGTLAGDGTDRATHQNGVAETYQTSLGDDEREANGHFVTDPAIATALCRWAIQPRPDGRCPRVLDPAVGSGAFALAAADRLADVAPEHSAAERLHNVVGVDSDPVALAVAAGRLLDRLPDATDTQLAVYESDFFDVQPGDNRTATLHGDRIEAGQFDAVVGNPPYVRQETAETDGMRDHLASFGPARETPYLDGERALSKRSDTYIYFLTHATRFLREGGRLAVVVPKKWLTTRYGESLQTFLGDHYRLHAVVGFDTRAFASALVDTVLLLAERTDDPTTRRETATQFRRIDEQQSVAELLAQLAGATAAPSESSLSIGRNASSRIVTVPQRRLVENGPDKRAHYLDAPGPLIRLLEEPPLTPLGSLGRISRGVMTGANDFFFLDAGSEYAESIDDQFLAPAIKSIRDTDSRRLGVADAERYLLDVHDYVTDLDLSGVEKPTKAVKDALSRGGYTGLLQYVGRGEANGYHERRSCADRRIWFDLGPLGRPAVFVPKFFDRRVFTITNPDGLTTSNAVDCLFLPDDVDERVVQGVLDSTVTRAVMECWGRSEGGGALQLLTYEITTLPVPDPTTFSPSVREKIRDATDALLDGDESARDHLDELVLDAIGSDISIDRLRESREQMVERRVGNATRTVPPLTVEDD